MHEDRTLSAECYSVLSPYLGHIKCDVPLESESKVLSPSVVRSQALEVTLVTPKKHQIYECLRSIYILTR